MKTLKLLTPLKTPELSFHNRVFMAPMTRSRAPERVPTELMKGCYAQRASAGLIFSEATQISLEGVGYISTPGIHTEEQIHEWRKVTDAVHQHGGVIFCQLWHVGRASHALFLRAERFRPAQDKSDAWNRGAYLATALGHCNECHTPRNILYALKHDRELAGEVLQGWKAYNITSDKTYGIGGWTDQQLADYLGKGHANGRGAASGPTGEVVQNGLQYLAPEDIAALVTYLRDVKPQQGQAGSEIDDQPPKVLASTADAPGEGEMAHKDLGQQLFERACAGCHLWNGQGRQSEAAALLGTQVANDANAYNLIQVILHGSKLQTAQGEVFMPSFARAYSDTEVAALGNFVLAHFASK
jgi:mono/diheme cytochrome c family protein